MIQRDNDLLHVSKSAQIKVPQEPRVPHAPKTSFYPVFF